MTLQDALKSLTEKYDDYKNVLSTENKKLEDKVIKMLKEFVSHAN